MKRIIRFDPSTDEDAFCMRKVQLKNRYGYVSKVGSDPLDFGQALHKALGAWRRDRAVEDYTGVDKYIAIAEDYYSSRICPKLPPRDLGNLQRVIRDYDKRYQVDPFKVLTLQDGDVAVELPFSIPLYENDSTIVMLDGVIDALGQYESEFCFQDIKHSSSRQPDSHMEEQKGRPQFHIYSYVLRKLGYVVDYYPSVIVDAIYISKQFPGAKLLRSEPHELQPHIVERTYANFLWRAKQLSELPDDAEWPYEYNACPGKYSLCNFNMICQLPTHQQTMPLDMMYIQREYNPAKFGD